MTIVGTGQVAGPAIGGGLVSWLGWRAVFFLNVPLVLVGIVATVMVLDSGRALRTALGVVQGRFDWTGAVLSTGALVTMLLAIMYGHREGWTSGWILTAGASSAVLMTTFIFWELRAASPMLDVRFFRDRTFSFGVSAAFLIFLGSSSIQFLTPFYIQEVLGYSAVEAGFAVVPGAICMSLLGPVCGRLSDSFGWRKFTVGGLLSSAMGMLLMSTLTENSSIAVVIIALMLTSSGMGIFYSPNTSSILSAVEPRNYGTISGFLNLIRNSANVSSVAMATAIVTSTMGSMGYQPTLAAVSCGGGAAVCSAFTIGTRNAYLVMASVLLTAASISAFKFQPRQQMVPAPSASD
jgi:MFS family permease